LILSLLIVLAFVFKIKAVIKADNANINVVVSYLGIIKIRKDYVVHRDEKSVFALYLVTKKGLKPTTTLADIIKKVKKKVPTDIAIVDLITVITQSARKKDKNSAFSYIYKKIRYDISIDVLIGIEDAFFTAVVCGILNAAAGAVLAVYNKKNRTIRVKAFPEFSNLKFSVKADCIIALAPADIIIGYAIYKKNKRR
jgi:hypothetical protein